MFFDLGTRKTGGGVDLEMIEDLARRQRPRVVHTEANGYAGRYRVGWGGGKQLTTSARSSSEDHVSGCRSVN